MKLPVLGIGEPDNTSGQTEGKTPCSRLLMRLADAREHCDDAFLRRRDWYHGDSGQHSNLSVAKAYLFPTRMKPSPTEHRTPRFRVLAVVHGFLSIPVRFRRPFRIYSSFSLVPTAIGPPTGKSLEQGGPRLPCGALCSAGKKRPRSPSCQGNWTVAPFLRWSSHGGLRYVLEPLITGFLSRRYRTSSAPITSRFRLRSSRQARSEVNSVHLHQGPSYRDMPPRRIRWQAPHSAS